MRLREAFGERSRHAELDALDSRFTQRAVGGVSDDLEVGATERGQRMHRHGGRLDVEVTTWTSGDQLGDHSRRRDHAHQLFF